MKKIAKNNLWKYLFWLGPFLFIVGLTAGLVSEQWGAIPFAFLTSGIVISGLWVVWQSQQSNWWKRRSTQAGTNALVATWAILAILGLINFLGDRYHLRADLTETQLFTLAPQSRELVSTLPQPVKVWVFDVTQNPQDRELLNNYQRQSSKFKFEYIDPQARPGLADKFGVKDYGEVYLESGEKRQLVQVVNENERLSEVRLTSRLQQITSATTAKVYLLQGHGERQLSAAKGAISQAIQGLGDKNYTTSPLNLAENPKVPEDAAVVVVAGPKRGLFESEVKALQEYLNRGGNLLLMIDPNTDPKLESLLQTWGVRLDNRLAVDVSGEKVGLGPAAPLVSEYGQHPITKDFGNGISFYPLARPLEITPVAGVEATPLLQTKPYPNSWAESDLQSEKLEFNPDKDLKGPLTLGVALTKKLPAKSTFTPQQPTPSPLPSPTTQNKTTPIPPLSPSPLPPPSPSSQIATESRLVVLGNSDFATDGLFQQQLNGDVFLNSVTWLSQQDQQPLSIRPKEAKNRRINLTTMQANLLILSSLLFLPLIGLIAAAIIWWKRR
ncbi:GldG family protein [aff. Roholtiella sp. LEGE 12411]|uniref:GldG family protein n=1 Tax=aff. Roholtiella sp. LEGE 12411 TaxID=1828822 RepID=UPI001882C115|nr:Gldg family protein [aff. Roholtiella sp. LEGE 12411]MBE9035644.1 Gldg family protein [aff. Roholtiella sp. LEGE 12411]